MADIDVQREKAGQNTWIWMAIAILAVAALLFWLASQEKAEAPVVMEDDSTEAVETDTTGAAGGGETVDLVALAGAPTSYMGRTVVIEDVDVASNLGERVFWANVSGQNPFLVMVEDDAGDASIDTGDTVDLEGTVEEVTESVVDEWIADGALRENARDEATFATHYLRVTEISGEEE